MRILLLFLLCCFSTIAQSQKEVSSVQYALKKIKSIYAGYEDKVKDERAFGRYISKILSKPITDTFETLSQITLYFNDQHLLMRDRLSEKPIDSLQCKSNLKNITGYLRKKYHSSIEGYWINDLNNCIVGIREISHHPSVYKGFVVESKAKAPPGYCLMTIKSQERGTYLTDLSQERMRYRVFLNTLFKGDSIFIADPYGRWRKLSNYQNGTLDHFEPVNLNNTLQVLDSQTVLITLPSFGSRDGNMMDSLVKANATLLQKSKTLIIDLRNNGGGGINAYLPLLPYIYTNPIVHCAGYQRCSNELIDEYAADAESYYKKGDSVRYQLAASELKKLQANRGQMLFFKGDTLLKEQSVQPYPQHVGVIVNRRCLSAAELLILDFRQSKKVTFFGESSGGAIDYLDAVTVNFPSQSYSLFVATTSRYLSPSEPSYDAKGIPPDVWIPKNTTNWVSFVKNYYER